jgi:hypothetical protein
VHPCFVGAFADLGDASRTVIDSRCTDRSHTFDSWNTTGVRARLGAWHPLSGPLNGARQRG